MRVLMAPDYRRHNPYQQLLSDGLSALGISVLFPTGYRRVLPLWRAVRENSPRVDVLHLHWQDAYIRSRNRGGMVVYALKLILDLTCVKASGCRIVWTVHNELPHDAKWPTLHGKLQVVVGRIADAVILHSGAASRQLRDQLGVPAEKVRVIPHGHYRDFYGPPVPQSEARIRLGLPVDGRLYLHFGMIRPYKGVEELLTSWAVLAGDSDVGHLVVVGQPLNDDYAQRLQDRASACRHASLRLAYVAHDQVPLYFSAADFVVLPFRRALTSGSLLLALSYGVPVIAPLFPFIQEAAKSDYLYDPAETYGLLNALRRTIRADVSPALRAISGSISHLSWSAIATETLQCYGAASQAADSVSKRAVQGC
jgi:beta-1,4-mannosyltransferase